MKLSQLLATKKVVASGFAAIAGLSAFSRGREEVVLSSLAPSVLADQGVTEYYALQLPRGTVFNTPEDIIAADLDVQKYTIETVHSVEGMEHVIVSRHQGTINILLDKYDLEANGNVYASVTAEQIAGKHVIGTLPPQLISAAGAYTAVTIKNFDHTKDGDLSGQELRDRLIMADKPIRLVEVEETEERSRLSDPSEFDIVFRFFVEGEFEVVDEFTKELYNQLQELYDDMEENYPPEAAEDPYENIDGVGLVQQVAKHYKTLKIHYNYDKNVSWTTKGYALYVLLGYFGPDDDEEFVTVECFKDSYPQTFEEEAKEEWAQYCKQLYRNFQHPVLYKEEWESEEIPFTDKRYEEDNPEWRKVLAEKSLG
ncbi:CRISPR-associated protein Csx16 [Paenibacillus campinasensis]|uniref:CRISPR-associated protein Csx16 n=1 Tax=Paenibacillus campinasensis TaxID=66347 RepID=UPI00117FD271|nr:CRISPR-associated protein Csx16 [Paenibacillus campinasensis]